jgi:hypothetical protein
MLRTNLSTRPFYNVRAVRALLGLAALIIAAFTLFNVAQLVRLSATQRTLSADAVRAETEAARLRSEALPPDVRITAVQPRREQDGSFAVNIGVQARRVEDVEAFIEALEATTPFKDVLPVEEQTGDGGLIEAVLDGRYAPTRPTAAADPTASADGKRASR